LAVEEQVIHLPGWEDGTFAVAHWHVVAYFLGTGGGIPVNVGDAVAQEEIDVSSGVQEKERYVREGEEGTSNRDTV